MGAISVLSKAKANYISNAVDSETLRKYQAKILSDLSNILANSFGPHGSNTCIKKNGGPNVYTKDGHTILCNVGFSGIIEESIRSDIESITSHIANTVGDGTTSAVILSKYIFDYIMETMNTWNDLVPADVIRSLNRVVNMVADEIKKSAKPATIDDIYDIAYISSNGDETISKMIRDIYAECGMGVFIDVAMTTAYETTIKYYDGMTLDTGYSDSCFVTNERDNSCEVDHPEIYFFEDPIDTKEMGVYLDSIISTNILTPVYKKNMNNIMPTVIVAPRVSRDMSSILDTLVQIQSAQSTGAKLPIAVITETHQVDALMDIAKMCGAKTIRKYIDQKMFERDVEAGIAPTPDTVFKWAGSADSVVAYSTKTKFIRPSAMKDENGEYSVEYRNLISYLETELKKCEDDGDDAHTIGTLRRRIHSLKSNLVEIYAGGMSTADRDAARHLMEDAVKNCRSAAANGIGWAANMSGMLAIDTVNHRLYNKNENNLSAALDREMSDALYSSYKSLIKTLYHTAVGKDESDRIFNVSMAKRMPINLHTMEFDGKAISSIESDIIIMQSVAKIIGIMVTCNQFLTPNPQMNIYTDPQEVE